MYAEQISEEINVGGFFLVTQAPEVASIHITIALNGASSDSPSATNLCYGLFDFLKHAR